MSPAGSSSVVDPALVSRWSRSVVGWPFKAGGRDKDGIDCFGLFLDYARTIGHPLPDYRYPPQECREHALMFAAHYHEHGEEIPRAEAVPGDIVLFKNSIHGVNHIAVLLGRNKFIHCTKAGVAIQSLNTPPFNRRAEMFLRLKTS